MPFFLCVCVCGGGGGGGVLTPHYTLHRERGGSARAPMADTHREREREDAPMAERMQAMGASVSMRRTMTPAKYQERVP